MGRTAAATADLTAAAVARAGGASTAQGAGEATTAGRGMRVLNPSFPSRRLISDVAWDSARGRSVDVTRVYATPAPFDGGFCRRF